MLHRQKALLLMLQQVGGIASSLQMMKWAFLLAQETPSRGGKTFYQFVPYQSGPYSFTLHRETNALIRDGLLEQKNGSDWGLTALGQKLEINLPDLIQQDVSQVTQHYGQLSSQKLIELICDKYSWFTVNSDITGIKKASRPVAPNAIYTAGYEGKTVDEFLNLLMESGISRLIDVRYNPVSRRYGFHKSTLSRLCKFLGIDYQHLPGLGIAGSERENLRAASQYESLFENYRCSLPARGHDLVNAVGLLNSKPSALVCMEADPRLCHRSVLAQHLTTFIDLPIEHLGYWNEQPSRQNQSLNCG